MLSYLKKIFAPEAVPVDVDPQDYYFDNTKASIRQMKNGRYRLLENGNEVVATYNRRRDAIRGAKRRGLEVTDVL